MTHPQQSLAQFFQFDCGVRVPQRVQVEWHELVEEASAGRLLPALAQQIRSMGIRSELSSELATLFDLTESLNSERNELFFEETRHVAVLLNGVAIRPVALKGVAYLLSRVFPNPGSRYLLDIDLLVAEHELPKAIECLGENGYAADRSDAFAEFRHHAAALKRPNHPNVEIHHRVGLGVSGKILPSHSLIARATPMNLNGAQILLPSPTDLITHLILHSQLSHPYYERIFPPLRALHDLCALQHRFHSEIDWDAISFAYRNAGQHATLDLHLRYATHVLGFPVVLDSSGDARSGLKSIRWDRRLLLNRIPILRFLDPIYIMMALFSRRAPLIPDILRRPAAWPRIMGRLLQVDFYRNLLGA